MTNTDKCVSTREHMAIGSLTREEIDIELEKGMKAIKEGKVYTADEVDAKLKKEFGI